mgnify:CR=1 FL=1
MGKVNNPADTSNLVPYTGATANISLNDNYLSNDGGSEGIQIADDGKVGIGTTAPSKGLYVDNGLVVKQRSEFVLTGSITADGDSSLTGVGTKFLTEVTIGDEITVQGETRQVMTVIDDLNLLVNSNFHVLAVDTSPELNPACLTVLRDNGSIGMTLDQDGRFGLGTANPSVNFEIFRPPAEFACTMKLSYDADSFATIYCMDDSHLSFATGEAGDLRLAIGGDVIFNCDGEMNIQATNFDEPVNLATGGTRLLSIGTNDGTDLTTLALAGHATMSGNIGFVKKAESFAGQSIISGSGNDTQIDFRDSNKVSLSVTGAIPNLNLIFPASSGNFTLLLTYTGDYSISNYKVFEHDETAADGDTDVLWAGGTVPNNTASGRDILSFFYDATPGADRCYGVASLAFATP